MTGAPTSTSQTFVLAGGWRTTVFLLVVVFFAWAPSLGGQFHYDDLVNVVMDPATSDPGALASRLANGFRPLLRLSYAADRQLWGFAPAGFLATNMTLHALTVLGVAALARRRVRSEGAVAFAAAIFALQPAHAAAVAWTSGRSTLLATALMVGALLAHERWIGSARWLGLSLLALALAVLAKETALVLPALLLLWEWTRQPMTPPREILRRVAPAAVTTAVLAVAAIAMSTRLREILTYSLALSPPSDALATNAAALPISLTLWWRPWALSVEQPQVFTATEMIVGAMALLAMVVGAVKAWQARVPEIALALLWPIVALLPTHSVFARLDPITEKALYPAWIGPSIALGAAFGCAPALWPRVRTVLATATLAALGALCWWRATVWADPAVLWREASVRVPDSARAWSNRALAELESGQSAMASESIARAQAMAPGDERINDAALAISLALPVTQESKR
ncbi:MAG: hypothetical protein WCF43_07280 [Steroidobacteraceae bacterium]